MRRLTNLIIKGDQAKLGHQGVNHTPYGCTFLRTGGGVEFDVDVRTLVLRYSLMTFR